MVGAEAGAPRRGRRATASSTRSAPVDADGVVAIRGMVEKPDPADAPSDLIIIGRYVLTPDVFDEIERLAPGRGGEIQLTDALRAQAARSPFHGVLSDVDRYDTGTPLGWLQAAVALSLRGAEFGADLATFLRGLPELATAPTPRRAQARWKRPGSSSTSPCSSTSNSPRRAVVEAGAPPRSRPVALVAHARRRSTASVSTSIVTTGSSAPSPTPSGSRRIGSGGRERRARQLDVGAAVELAPVGAVDLAPAGRAVGRQPQVGLVEVAEQQELAHLPGRRQAQHVLRRARGRPVRSPSRPRSPSAA